MTVAALAAAAAAAAGGSVSTAFSNNSHTATERSQSSRVTGKYCMSKYSMCCRKWNEDAGHDMMCALQAAVCLVQAALAEAVAAARAPLSNDGVGAPCCAVVPGRHSPSGTLQLRTHLVRPPFALTTWQAPTAHPLALAVSLGAPVSSLVWCMRAAQQRPHLGWGRKKADVYLIINIVHLLAAVTPRVPIIHGNRGGPRPAARSGKPVVIAVAACNSSAAAWAAAMPVAPGRAV